MQVNKLTDAQIDTAIDHIIENKHLELLPKKLGFKSRLELHKYCKQYPEFAEQLEEAKKASCKYLEDDLLFVSDIPDAKEAKIKMDAITKLLAYLDPSKYSQKIDLNMNQTISIRAAIDSGNKRVNELMRDVSPAIDTLDIEKLKP